MKHLLSMLGLFGLLAASVATVGVAEAAPTEIKIGSDLPSDSVWGTRMRYAARVVTKDTEGRVKLTVLFNQGSAATIVRKVKAGQLDGIATTLSGLALLHDDLRVLDLPRAFESVDEVTFVRRKMWRRLGRAMATKRYWLGPAFHLGWDYLFSTARIQQTSDLLRQRVRPMESDRVMARYYEDLGVTQPRPIDPTRAAAELQSGSATAVDGSVFLARPLGWGGPAKYRLSFPLRYGLGATVIGTATRAKLSEADRATLDSVLTKQANAMTREVANDERAFIVALRDAGVQEVIPRPDLMADWDADARATQAGLIGVAYSKKALDAMVTNRNEYRESRR